MSVTTVFDFDPAEHYRASRDILRLSPLRWLAWVFAAIALAMVVWTVVGAWGRTTPFALFLNALPYATFGAVWLALIPVTQRRAATRLASRDASVRGPQRRSVDEVGYHSSGNGVNLDLPWHVMVRAIETEHFFLFFVNKQCAYYVPKRALGAGEAEAVRALVRGGLGDRARLLAA